MAKTDIHKVLGEINKNFGDSTAHFLTEDFRPEVKVFPSGSLTVDLALGRGGLPRGRIIEVFGPEMSGKTTMCFLHIAQVQRANEGYCVFVDAEHAFDPKLAAEYGVDLESLIYINPKTAENAVDAIDALVRSGEVRLIVVDSVSAMLPTKIAESSMEQQTIGLLARFMSQACQKLTGVAYAEDCSIVFINQIREKIGGYAPAGVTPTTTSGGKALPFYASVRLQVRMGDKLKNKDEIFGHIVKVKVIKNKVGVPFKEAAFPLIYGQGVDHVDEISQLSVLGGVINQRGAWFRYEDATGEPIVRDDITYKWQGRAAFTEFLRENPFFMMELEDRIRGVEIEAPDGEAVADTDTYDVPEAEGVTA